MAAELERLLRGAAPAGVEIEIATHRAEPSLFPVDSPPMRLTAEATERACGVAPAFVRSGGSIPVVAQLAAKGIPVDRRRLRPARGRDPRPQRVLPAREPAAGRGDGARAAAGARPPAALMATVVFTRGGLAESVHEVAWCATGPDGEVTSSSDDGAPALGVFARSALKPLQALPAVRAGVLESFGLGAPHLALACASHGGGPQHLAVAREMLDACGLTEDALACGPLEPRDPAVADALRQNGRQATPLHHNCSGKHALGLALCVGEGWATDGYVDAGHPLQLAMHAAVAEAAGRSVDDVPYGADGCGMLAFSIPLAALAARASRGARRDGSPARCGRTPTSWPTAARSTRS